MNIERKHTENVKRGQEKDITCISDDIKKLDIDDKNLSKIVIQLQTDQKYLERDFAIFKDELEN